MNKRHDDWSHGLIIRSIKQQNRTENWHHTLQCPLMSSKCQSSLDQQSKAWALLNPTKRRRRRSCKLSSHERFCTVASEFAWKRNWFSKRQHVSALSPLFLTYYRQKKKKQQMKLARLIVCCNPYVQCTRCIFYNARISKTMLAVKSDNVISLENRLLVLPSKVDSYF